MYITSQVFLTTRDSLRLRKAQGLITEEQEQDILGCLAREYRKIRSNPIDLERWNSSTDIMSGFIWDRTIMGSTYWRRTYHLLEHGIVTPKVEEKKYAAIFE